MMRKSHKRSRPEGIGTRCALLAAESHAGQYHHNDIELAAAHLLGMLDAER